MTERRYREDEVREIFELATSRTVQDPPSPAIANGLTLADIQSIGLEVGIAPDQVARAVQALNARRLMRKRTSFGMPIEVARTVALPRAVTDVEWEQLVAELRTTFKAKGKITLHGGLREWSNGNLHAFIEPTETGYRLRLGTFKGDATGVNALGVTGLIVSAATFGSLMLSGNSHWNALFVSGVFAASGVAAFATNLLRLPRWAREREEQMTHIASSLRSIMGLKPDEHL